MVDSKGHHGMSEYAKGVSDCSAYKGPLVYTGDYNGTLEAV